MNKFMGQYDYKEAEELTITITLAEYRELVQTSTLYAMEHRDEPRPVSYDNIREEE